MNEQTDIIPKLSWRVGVHVDDVIIEKNNIYGTGVNVAARLEAKCNPEQILISNIVHQQIKNKVEEKLFEAGEIEQFELVWDSDAPARCKGCKGL